MTACTIKSDQYTPEARPNEVAAVLKEASVSVKKSMKLFEVKRALQVVGIRINIECLTRALLGGGAFERPPPQVFRG